MTLYLDSNFLSPYAMSAHVGLQEKGLPFEVRLVDLDAREQFMAPYTQRAPTCRVPALSHDGFHLTESSAILEYLEECFPAPEYVALYPADVRLRARARQLQAWLRSDLMALRQERSTIAVFHSEADASLSDAAMPAMAKLLRVAELLLKPGQTNLFDTWSIADTELAVMLKRLRRAELPDWLAAYADLQWQRPAVQRWLRHNQEARS
ncbi:glutathione S-transferase [Bordetella holmesii F627]|nr:glutathione S-transferase [Bordetella holmesii F627]